MFAIVISSALFAAVGGALLLAVGLRGRRVDDHPVCRRCGFDLFGKPATSTRCGECGADLTRRRAVRVGNRVGRGRLATAGAAAVIASVVAVASLGYVHRRGVDTTRYEPYWTLVWDVESPTGARRAAVLAELKARAADGRLTRAKVDAWADRMLAIQVDPHRVWLADWGDALESLRRAGRLDQDRWQRYCAAAVRLALEVRPCVRRGDPVPFRVRIASVRGGAAGFTVRWDRRSVRIGGEAVSNSHVWDSFIVSNGQEQVIDEGRFYLRREGLARMSDGVQHLEVDGSTTACPLPKVPSDLVTHAFRAGTAWRLTSAPDDTVAVDDGSSGPAVAAALGADGVAFDVLRTTPHGTRMAYLANVNVSASVVPADVAYDAVVRFGPDEYRAGSVVFRRGESGSRKLGVVIPWTVGDHRTSADVVLRPSRWAAAETVDVTTISGVNLVFPNVPYRNRAAEDGSSVQRTAATVLGEPAARSPGPP